MYNDVSMTLISFWFLGRIEALKHGQNDIDIARNDSECGICLEQFKDYREGDILQCFKIVEKKAPIDWGTW